MFPTRVCSWRKCRETSAPTDTENAVRAFLLRIVLSALATPAQAQSLQVTGYAGELGEWELTASVTEKISSGTKEFSGPLTMRHVGICSQDGPEERTGEIRLQISEATSRLNATLLVAEVECTYIGRLSDSYTGLMNCPERQAVPLTLWLK
jgi:hypothetical protein